MSYEREEKKDKKMSKSKVARKGSDSDFSGEEKPTTKAAAAPPPTTTISVVIKLPSGEAFPMNLPTSETVMGLKRRLASDQGVPPERLSLSSAGKPLDTPGATLSACGITNEAMIKV